MKTQYRAEGFKGLTHNEVLAKIETEGYNELPSSKPKNVLSIALGVVKEPMFLLLVACGSLYLILGDLQEGLMLGVFSIVWFEIFKLMKRGRSV